MENRSLAPGLYVAATPIGNLGDVSARLRSTLAAADGVLCEDTRVTGKLLKALGVDAPLRPYHDHNGAAVRPRILEDLSAGKALVLVSDAGTPLIADPGFKLVKEAREAGISVFSVPGPSAVVAALSIAGVPTDHFSFHGFLPPKSAARQSRLAALKDRDETLIFYETGPRLGAALADLVTAMGDVPVVVARELTKLHEEVVSDVAQTLADRYQDTPPKGEIVLIIPPRAPTEWSDEAVGSLMAEALETMSLKDASASVALQTGRKKRDLYQAWRKQDD